ncbi:MAG: hypothetical protein JJE36_00855 [Coriobacteriia bacterium]|nr:hypothetical protein [Coriobacteriia bacterium]
MPKVTGVRLRYTKTLWFDQADTNPLEGDIVIVQTDRGQELGLVQHAPHDAEVSALKAELKPIIRIATEEDLEKAIGLGEKEKAALVVFRESIKRCNLDMKPVDIEYIFGGDKIIFYFSAEERIDFRSLVKDLAAHFHMRIDMRQVGVRDEARMVGGIGHCGEVLCCARLGGEFAPVSIKMAKEQGLPLNPLKISGLCGRLMCCLRYEVEAYKDFNARSPRKNATIDSPLGEGKVTALDALREIVTVRFRNEEDNSSEELKVPLSKMSCGKGGDCKCPCSISKEALAEIMEKPDTEVDDFLLPKLTFKDSDGKAEPSQDASNADVPNADVPKNEKKRPRRNRGGRNRNNGGAKNSAAVNADGASTENKSGESKPSGEQKKNSAAERPAQRPRRSVSNGRNNNRQPEHNTQEANSAHKVEPGARIPRRRNRGTDASQRSE